VDNYFLVLLDLVVVDGGVRNGGDDVAVVRVVRDGEG